MWMEEGTRFHRIPKVASYFFSTDDVEKSSEVQKLLLDKDIAWIIGVNKDLICSFAARHVPAAR